MGEGLREGRPPRTDREEPAETDLFHRTQVGIAVADIVRAVHVVAAAEQRHRCRHAEPQLLERRELAIRAPEVHRGATGVDFFRGLVPTLDVGAERLYESVAGVTVTVDESRHHNLPLRIDHLAPGELRRNLRRGADRHDPITHNCHRAVLNHPTLSVHRNDRTARD